ncbi:hypothetical protein OBBRIDRAFT_829143 [Obba rivulosa]|uniref:Uncharacterized protein n=1 Tax=Obba rivulosa TaxID=1052685 RepID=A0A8E2AN70_9APHY|nr:hypothetical protein OBBRIDRAFT_829143 [Obba rivulosa]
MVVRRPILSQERSFSLGYHRDQSRADVLNVVTLQAMQLLSWHSNPPGVNETRKYPSTNRIICLNTRQGEVLDGTSHQDSREDEPFEGWQPDLRYRPVHHRSHDVAEMLDDIEGDIFQLNDIDLDMGTQTS